MEADALVARQPFRFLHGIGRRDCFGRSRVHTVTWFDDWPSVEGAEAEDYLSSRALISLIKDGKVDVKNFEELPDGYEDFEIVRHRNEISGPWARRGLAVKIVVDDLDAWAVHAYLRARTRGRV